MNEDRKIFEWLGEGCWHEFPKGGAAVICINCGACWSRPGDLANPKYTTPEGFISLLEGVRAKGYGLEFWIDPVLETYSEDPYLITLYDEHDEDVAESSGPSLPQALRLAVLKLTEANNEQG